HHPDTPQHAGNEEGNVGIPETAPVLEESREEPAARQSEGGVCQPEYSEHPHMALHAANPGPRHGNGIDLPATGGAKGLPPRQLSAATIAEHFHLRPQNTLAATGLFHGTERPRTPSWPRYAQCGR